MCTSTDCSIIVVKPEKLSNINIVQIVTIIFNKIIKILYELMTIMIIFLLAITGRKCFKNELIIIIDLSSTERKEFNQIIVNSVRLNCYELVRE